MIFLMVMAQLSGDSLPEFNLKSAHIYVYEVARLAFEGLVETILLILNQASSILSKILKEVE